MKNVLVIVDAQNDFIDGSLGTDEAKYAISKICQRILSFKNGLIITTMDTHGENYLETKEGKYLPVKHCIKATNGWGLNKEIASTIIHQCSKKENDVQYEGLEKPTFGSLELIKMISNYVGDEPFNVIFAGFCTDICVITNALIIKTAFYAQANVIIDEPACAGSTPERHKSAIEVMKSCQINIFNPNNLPIGQKLETSEEN